MLEKEIEEKVRKYGLKLGYLCYKWVSPGSTGVPDRIFISPTGKVLFIEFKAFNKKPTVHQARQIKKLREHLAEVYVVDTVDIGKTILDTWS